MSKVIWKGSRPHLESSSVNVDEVGMCDVTEAYMCKDERMAADALDFSADDVDFPLVRPRVMGSSSDRVEGGMWRITRNFRGLLDERMVGDYKLYNCSTVTNNEPIQTHPDFLVFAGIPYREKNGAVFDGTTGDFVRFKPFLTPGDMNTDDSIVDTTTKNRKAGVTDYRCPIVRLTETKLILAEQLQKNIDNLGFVDNEVLTFKTPIRPRYKHRNWALVRADPEWAGEGVYKLQREWALSGPRGWDKDIYPDKPKT